MNISQFFGALSGGGARPNRFRITVDFPAFAATQDEIRKTAFLAQSATLPPSNLGVIEVAHAGRVIKLPGDRTFDEWQVTFYNDTDFALRDAFEAWQNAMNSYNSNTGMLAPEDSMSTVTAEQLDGQDRTIKTYVFKYAWPSVVGEIELAQDSNDQIEQFPVTFVYSDIDNGVST